MLIQRGVELGRYVDHQLKCVSGVCGLQGRSGAYLPHLVTLSTVPRRLYKKAGPASTKPPPTPPPANSCYEGGMEEVAWSTTTSDRP
jgi:hypothetical protein